jgi:hypothetical protein
MCLYFKPQERKVVHLPRIVHVISLMSVFCINDTQYRSKVVSITCRCAPCRSFTVEYLRWTQWSKAS